MFRCAVVVGGFLLVAMSALANDEAVAPGEEQVVWLDNYRASMDQAKADRRQALVWFSGETASADDNANNNLERLASEHPPLAEKLRSAFVPVRVPLAKLREQDEGEVGPAGRLVDHPAFAELRGQAGLSESGGIGRRAGLRIQWGNPCRFKSCLSQHSPASWQR
jgi:hypothetical protein